MRKVFALLIPLLLISGCLSSGESPVEIQEPTYTIQEITDNHSHQFWNVMPMSVGNASVVSFNETGELNFTLDLTAQFHDPLSWDRGSVNYSLIHDNTTIFSAYLQNEINAMYHKTISNATGNYTVQIHASGSDNETNNYPGDYYVAKSTFRLSY
jgi:hypothetical protein|tara:strand:- start:13142 stop:13606 length:465 start_codon:yes stop_codon:yes gene_type:complete